MASRVDGRLSTASTREEPCKYCGIEGGGLPKMTLNGENRVPEWVAVLYDHSAIDKNLNH